MYHIQEAMVVEGRYDKNALSQVVDAVILETSGFGIFKNSELVALLRRLAKTRGLIVLTDSDGAGFLIRSHIRSSLPAEGVKHAYIPDMPGRRVRRSQPGAPNYPGRPICSGALRRGRGLCPAGRAAPAAGAARPYERQRPAGGLKCAV